LPLDWTKNKDRRKNEAVLRIGFDDWKAEVEDNIFALWSRLGVLAYKTFATEAA
jgi:hypothetical protein